ncbi:hypothetical protein SNE40_018119 [Patella caerulea]|uniref:Uncharacterized protein n=1 Tax=Patella caerulea TaxID=87958 RepID=A0AAN8J739_PATCE
MVGRGLDIVLVISTLILIWIVFRFNSIPPPQKRSVGLRGKHVNVSHVPTTKKTRVQSKRPQQLPVSSTVPAKRSRQIPVLSDSHRSVTDILSRIPATSNLASVSSNSTLTSNELSSTAPTDNLEVTNNSASISRDSIGSTTDSSLYIQIQEAITNSIPTITQAVLASGLGSIIAISTSSSA